MMENEIVMPHNERAEQMLLAALFVDPTNAGECYDIVPSDLYSTKHQKIFELVKFHSDNRLPIDAGLIGSKLDSDCRAAIFNCLEDPGPATDIGHTVRQIKHYASRRRMIEISNAIVKRAQDDDNAEATIEFAYRQVASMASIADEARGVSLRHIYTADRMVDEYLKYIKSLKNNRFITGIDEIDKRIRGVAGGEVLTILARAGSFKTALLQNLLTNYTRASTRGAVMFSLEMPVASVTERYFQILDGCTGREVMKQFTDPEHRETAEAAVNQFKRDLKKLFIIPSKIGLESIPQYIKLIEQEHQTKIGLIGVDYLGLMECEGDSEYQQVSKLARGVKEIAKRVNLPLIMLSQVSRKGGDGEVEISLDMGRGSGAVEEAADFVLGLWRIEKPSCVMSDEKKEYDLICRILKNRKGPKGSRWVLELDASTLRFGRGSTEYLPPKKRGKKGAC